MIDGREGSNRDIDLRAEMGRLLGRDADGTTAVVCKTVAVGTYPTVAGKYFAVREQTLFGDETEGAVVTLADRSTNTFFAVHLGATVPPVGTQVLVVTTPEGRRTFRY